MSRPTRGQTSSRAGRTLCVAQLILAAAGMSQAHFFGSFAQRPAQQDTDRFGAARDRPFYEKDRRKC
jgi:hypothetical protein